MTDQRGRTCRCGVAKFACDPFNVLLSVFGRQSEAAVTVVWVSDLHAEEGAWGRTHFDSNPIIIELDVDCPVRGALDVLAHELAHVIAGFEAGHGPEWEAAKAALLAALEAEPDDEDQAGH